MEKEEALELIGATASRQLRFWVLYFSPFLLNLWYRNSENLKETEMLPKFLNFYQWKWKWNFVMKVCKSIIYYHIVCKFLQNFVKFLTNFVTFCQIFNKFCQMFLQIFVKFCEILRNFVKFWEILWNFVTSCEILSIFVNSCQSFLTLVKFCSLSLSWTQSFTLHKYRSYLMARFKTASHCHHLSFLKEKLFFWVNLKKIPAELFLHLTSFNAFQRCLFQGPML